MDNLTCQTSPLPERTDDVGLYKYQTLPSEKIDPRVRGAVRSVKKELMKELRTYPDLEFIMPTTRKKSSGSVEVCRRPEAIRGAYSRDRHRLLIRADQAPPVAAATAAHELKHAEQDAGTAADGTFFDPEDRLQRETEAAKFVREYMPDWVDRVCSPGGCKILEGVARQHAPQHLKGSPHRWIEDQVAQAEQYQQMLVEKGLIDAPTEEEMESAVAGDLEQMLAGL